MRNAAVIRAPGYDEPKRCRCNVYLSTACTATATAEDGLCNECRRLEQPVGPNNHVGNWGWPHSH